MLGSPPRESARCSPHGRPKPIPSLRFPTVCVSSGPRSIQQRSNLPHRSLLRMDAMASARAHRPGDNKQDVDASSINSRSTDVVNLLKRTTSLPILWIIAMSIVAVLSAFDIQRTEGGDLSVQFTIGTTTLIALALIWLPMLLRVAAMLGGSVKAGGIEANIAGLLSQSEAIDLGVKARQISSAGTDSERTAAVQEFETSVARVTVTSLDAEEVLPESILSQLAQNYERLRRDMSPGAARTSAMTRIVNEARVRAASAPGRAKAKVPSLLKSSSQGERIVGLGLAQETADPDAVDLLVPLVANSATAFEMYHALLAIQEVALNLSLNQRTRITDVLRAEQLDPRGLGIAGDPGLPTLFKRTIGILNGRE